MGALHIHLDPVGGVAGDMFAAAILDGWPTLGDGLVDALRSAGLAGDVDVRWERVLDEVLAGSRFIVDDPRERARPRPPHHAVLTREHAAQAAHAHAHVPFRDVRERIARSSLPKRVVERALDIFTHLARAEAQVHGFADVDAVVFHEVGAMDSVADVVAAAWLIERLGALSWSTSSLPLGNGTIATAHGQLPIPTPATAALLADARLPTHDDGRAGERITPTGAAILRHLMPSTARPAGTLGRAGIGWGTKRFPGLPNVLRAFAVDAAAGASVARDVVSVVSFEIDDQSAEDLAVALEHVRALPGVLDALQAPAFGKKGRMVTQVRVLARADATDDVVRACLVETTTLGVRIERDIERATLSREERATAGGVRVKRVTRPDGARTAKADVDDVAAFGSAHARAAARRKAEDDT